MILKFKIIKELGDVELVLRLILIMNSNGAARSSGAKDWRLQHNTKIGKRKVLIFRKSSCNLMRYLL